MRSINEKRAYSSYVRVSVVGFQEIKILVKEKRNLGQKMISQVDLGFLDGGDWRGHVRQPRPPQHLPRDETKPDSSFCYLHAIDGLILHAFQKNCSPLSRIQSQDMPVRMVSGPLSGDRKADNGDRSGHVRQPRPPQHLPNITLL